MSNASTAYPLFNGQDLGVQQVGIQNQLPLTAMQQGHVNRLTKDAPQLCAAVHQVKNGWPTRLSKQEMPTRKQQQQEE